MVSVNPNPAQGFYYFDPINMGLPGANSVPPQAPPPPPTSTASNTTVYSDDPSKKIRKPYTITKSRKSWTEQEHEKFLEALQLFDRDWKKIEAFVGSKTVIQIRSHAQKYFLKVQKNGTSEHVPPPRPKRKADHPYPQKAPKNASVAPRVSGPFQSSSALHEPGFTYRRDSSSVPGNLIAPASLPSWSFNSVPPVAVSQVTKDDAVLAGPTVVHNSCYSSSSESTPRTCSFGETVDRGDHWKPSRVLPDFAQVYSFIGSVFDPGSSGHLQKLKQMDPINLETVLLLMRNLSVNLTSPEFEDHRRLLSTYDAESGGVKLSYNDIRSLKSASAVPTA
ncbi:Protein REVEILLE 6 [Hibiscus syriacus]|uniref:Protein REVEILLE 6 n=1 Tax=Hibiscus syriacus TaxID=106335 RepID=A0A6A3AX58_HIBSY|nr:protein REVEILLE 3-like [Hibiscus syriacus]KAE8707997.1 Protein REVEILLE 6 [Hibiscus syriacus]